MTTDNTIDTQGASEQPQSGNKPLSKQVANLKLAVRTYENEKVLAKTVAANIKRKRIEAGLTQAELARLTRKKQPDIARQERSSYGRHTIKSLNKLAVALGTTASDLLNTGPDTKSRQAEAQSQSTIDSEVDEMLFMAFVGLWVRDEEGNFVSLDDKYGVLKDHLKQDITNLIAQENERYLKTHAHNTKDGWCCACDYDIAVMRSESAQEANKAVVAKNYAYWERNQLVGVLSRLYPSHLARHDENDKEWEDDWRNIVCVHTPVGQATWHLQDNDMPMFAHLKRGADHWDGHTTEEKYHRLAQLTADKKQNG